MDPVAVSAINAIRSALDGLLPSDVGASLQFLPHVLRPIGLGGYVGPHSKPEGDLVGRWLEGSVAVTIDAASSPELETRRSAVVAAYVAADRDELRRSGIFRLSLGKQGEVEGGDAAYRQTLQFDIRAEYVHEPEEGGRVITDLVHDVYVPRSGPLRLLHKQTFSVDPLPDFEVFDDPAAGTDAPSAWSYDADGERIMQTSSIRGGRRRANVSKPGTALVLRRVHARDGMLRVSLRSDSGGGIGVVFRWQSPEDFYFFIMDATVGYRILARKARGRFRRLREGGFDPRKGYESGRTYEMRLAFEGEALEVALDGQPILRGRNAVGLEAGRVGLYTRNDPQAFFHGLSLTGIGS